MLYKISPTRKVFEELLDLYDELFGISNSKKLERSKAGILNCLMKIAHCNLFEIDQQGELLTYLLNEESRDLYEEKTTIAFYIYKYLLGLSILKIFPEDEEPNYALSLELGRLSLPYDKFMHWQESILVLLLNSSLLSKHNFTHPEWKEINSEKDFTKYKNKIESITEPLRYTNRLDIIPQAIYIRLNRYFKRFYDRYVSYIFENYSSIKSEFSYYNKKIRVYLWDYRPKKTRNDLKYGFRIYSYISKDEEPQILIHQTIFDFIPFGFYNIEEFLDRQVGGMESGISLDNFDGDAIHCVERTLDHVFGIVHIHQELFNIFLRSANYDSLLDLFTFIYKCKGYKFNNDKSSKFLTAEFNGTSFLFELLTSNQKSIRSLMKLINVGKKQFKKHKYVMISIHRPDKATQGLAEKLDFELIDFNGIFLDYLNLNNTELLHLYIKSKIDSIAPQNTDVYSEGLSLIHRLESCPSGLQGWIEYEKVCTDIFRFVFESDFRKYITKFQSHTHDGIFRRDLIINNNYKDNTSFWAQVKSEFAANIIIVDFKNYDAPLEQNECYIPTKYLNLKSGNFCIIVARSGFNESAKTLQKRTFQLDNKLIIALDNNDLTEMLREKMVGEDSSYRLENLKFMFYESL